METSQSSWPFPSWDSTSMLWGDHQPPFHVRRPFHIALDAEISPECIKQGDKIPSPCSGCLGQCTQNMLCKESCRVPDLYLNLFTRGYIPAHPGEPEVTAVPASPPDFLLCSLPLIPAVLPFQVRILGKERLSKTGIDKLKEFFFQSTQCKFFTWPLKLNMLENPNSWRHFTLLQQTFWWYQLHALNPNDCAGLFSLLFPEPWGCCHCFPALLKAAHVF